MEHGAQSTQATVTEVTALGAHGIKESNFLADNQTPIIDLVHRETSITTLVLVLASKELRLEPRSWEILWPVPSSYGIKVGSLL
jgi:hypothetical protein